MKDPGNEVGHRVPCFVPWHHQHVTVTQRQVTELTSFTSTIFFSDGCQTSVQASKHKLFLKSNLLFAVICNGACERDNCACCSIPLTFDVCDFSNSLIIHNSTRNHCFYTTLHACVSIPNEKLDENL